MGSQLDKKNFIVSWVITCFMIHGRCIFGVADGALEMQKTYKFAKYRLFFYIG